MSVAFLFQIGLNLIFGLALFVAFKRLNRPAKDDPRLSRGLQLLQSKIAILEDLSDRSEVQVSQMVAMMEQKCKDVQNKIQQAERHVHLINTSMEKSLEVAKIFQDKIPHQEIIERQNTVKYVQAARLAHRGLSLEEIRKQVDVPLGELEFIMKVNRTQLMFSEADLPAWAQPASATLQEENSRSRSEQFTAEPPEIKAPEPAQKVIESELPSTMDFYSALAEQTPTRDITEIFDVKAPELKALEKLGEQFRQACQDYQVTQEAFDVMEENQSAEDSVRDETGNEARVEARFEPYVAPKLDAQGTADALVEAKVVESGARIVTKGVDAESTGSEEPVVRKVEFPRIGISLR